MIKHINGDILNANENIIVQQVNCHGVMGAGLAKQLAQRYPVIVSPYKKLCFDKGMNCLGDAQLIQVSALGPKSSHKHVANLFGQKHYGRNSNVIYTDYKAFTEGLSLIKQYAGQHEFSVAIPYGIGCGLANGNWNVIEDIINNVFSNTNIDVTIYKYN